VKHGDLELMTDRSRWQNHSYQKYFIRQRRMYTVSQKYDTALACYNFDVHQPFLIIFDKNVAKKVKS